MQWLGVVNWCVPILSSSLRFAQRRCPLGCTLSRSTLFYSCHSRKNNRIARDLFIVQYSGAECTAARETIATSLRSSRPDPLCTLPTEVHRYPSTSLASTAPLAQPRPWSRGVARGIRIYPTVPVQGAYISLGPVPLVITIRQPRTWGDTKYGRAGARVLAGLRGHSAGSAQSLSQFPRVYKVHSPFFVYRAYAICCSPFPSSVLFLRMKVFSC